MDPQKGSLCVPLIKNGPLEEPRGSSVLMSIAPNVVVFRRIWRTQPIFGVLLHMVTCSPSQRARSMTGVTYNERLILFISLAICCIASIIVVSSCGPFANTLSSYPEPSRCRQSTLYRLDQDDALSCMPVTSEKKRTVHDYFHTIHKSVDHFQGLYHSHPTFLLSETVKPL